MKRVVFAAVAALLLPAAAHSAGFSTIGPRIGFSSGPDQVLVGGQLQLGDVAPSLDFVPNAELGFGDDLTVVSVNGDFHYRIDVQGTNWQPYAGAGIALNFVSWDNDRFGDGNDTEAGGSLIFGADVPTQSGSRFFVELKVGLGDTADFKALAGWNFKLR